MRSGGYRGQTPTISAIPFTQAAMRTNIDIDDALIAEAMAVSGLTTKKAVVEEALRRLVRQKQQEQTLALYGTVDWGGNLEQSRQGRANTK